jgi:prepilin-type N-terminal cleavage/methylation domain-containing protein
MKISRPFLGGVAPPVRPCGRLGEPSLPGIASTQSAFTMIEIAICLAIIGIALVSIIGVLPMGLNVQKDNREETIINQDATVFMEYIRNGARGADDLTNYVYEITNSWTLYNTNGTVNGRGGNDYTYANFFIVTPPYPPVGSRLTNGLDIIGLMSTPEYIATDGTPLNNILNVNYYSNHIVACVRSISGPASEKPPQDNNGTVREDSFSYKIVCENVPVATPTPAPTSFSTNYAANLQANLHELRLTFLWPLLPNGKTGNGRQTFRTTVAGQIVTNIDAGQILYFFQPQSFTNVSAP